MALALNAASTADALPYEKLCHELSVVWRAMERGETTCPVRLSVPLSMGGVLLSMAASDSEFAVSKIVTVNTLNATRLLPVVQAEVTVMRAIDGARLLHLDGEVVTARRTAALSVAAVLRLAPRLMQPINEAHTSDGSGNVMRDEMPHVHVLIVGNGQQALAHRDAFECVFAKRGIDVRVQSRRDRSKEGAEGFCITAEEIQWADVIVTATSSSVPVLDPQCMKGLKARCVICAIGAYTSTIAEIPAEIVRKCRIVVDNRSACVAEAGDLLQAGVHPNDMEEICRAAPHDDLLDDRPILFKCVGTALWDLAACRCAVSCLAMH